MKIGVTGAQGFIGHHLVHSLLANGIDVVALDNQHRAMHRLPKSKHLQSVVGDIRYPSHLRAFHNCVCVINLAAESSVMRCELSRLYAYEANFMGVQNLIDYCLQHQIRLVQASSREVYGEVEKLPVDEDMPWHAKNLYGKTKMWAEGALMRARLAGLDTSILRFANVIGTGDKDRLLPLWLTAAHRGESLKVFGGQQVIDFVPVRLVTQALLLSAVTGNQGPINIASGKGTQILELAQKIQVLRPNTQIELLPPREVEVLGFQAKVDRMVQLGIVPPEDPLSDLPLLADYYALAS